MLRGAERPEVDPEALLPERCKVLFVFEFVFESQKWISCVEIRAVARISTQIPLDAPSNLRNSTSKNLNETPPGTENL